jgi:hypothetical protein
MWKCLKKEMFKFANVWEGEQTRWADLLKVLPPGNRRPHPPPTFLLLGKNFLSSSSLSPVVFPKISDRGLESATHRFNIELDLQSLFGLRVTWFEQLYLFAEPETPQPHPSPRIWNHIRGARALLVSQDRRHLFVTPWRYHQ